MSLRTRWFSAASFTSDRLLDLSGAISVCEPFPNDKSELYAVPDRSVVYLCILRGGVHASKSLLFSETLLPSESRKVCKRVFQRVWFLHIEGRSCAESAHMLYCQVGARRLGYWFGCLTQGHTVTNEMIASGFRKQNAPMTAGLSHFLHGAMPRAHIRSNSECPCAAL